MTDPFPLVSVILSTHDRPEFFPIALGCYAHQTYSNRELIVVDDSIEPVDEGAVTAAGGRLIRVRRGATLGMKLNRGGAEARGSLLQKMDDDDWKGPEFLDRMVTAYLEEQRTLCRPIIAGVGPFLYFDLARWEIRHSDEGLSQASILYARLDWEDCPFRPIPNTEDLWFFSEQRKRGSRLLAVSALESFLQVRHSRHEWMHMPGGQRFDDYLQSIPLYDKTPEELLPAWAVAAYRPIHTRLVVQK